MCSDSREASRICAFYSFTGILFMGWVGLMITHQPFFIGGLEDVDHCRNSAFGAMAMFILTFTLSLLYLCYDSTCRKLRPSAYDQVSLNERASNGGGPGFPVGMTDYEVNIEMTPPSTPRPHLSEHAPYSDKPSAPPSGSGLAVAGGRYSDEPSQPQQQQLRRRSPPPSQQKQQRDEDEGEEGQFAATPSSSVHSGPPVDLLS